MTERKRIGLALSGGIARASVHIGVLSVLERAGIPIDCVAGTSAGSIIGAAYCAGLPMPLIRRLATTTSWRAVAKLVWPRRGLVSFAKLEALIEEQLGVLDIRDLSIPFAPVATDMLTGERVIFRNGSLATAVRASCSVPGFVTPVEIDGRLYCDGGVTDNLPVDAARALGADYVIGVDLFVPSFGGKWGPLGIGLAAMENLIRRAGGGLAEADCLIVPDLAGKSYFRFSQSEEFISLGETAAEHMLPVIRDALRIPVSTA